MRLTLRTMLAYLDDILEPEDAEDINKKITESDFATSLIHRTRDCVRRVRLGTPALEGKGLAADANTVAEYLDNTLESARVPEFEKVCLESDVHLAEVASCHQILTLVLGEPADVDALSRNRMYELVSQTETVAPPKPPEPVAPPLHRTPRPSDTPDIIAAKRSRPEVPDYLRESARARRWPLVSTIAVAAVVTLAILLVAGPPELREQIAKWTGRGAAPQAEPVQQNEPVVTPDEGSRDRKEPEATGDEQELTRPAEDRDLASERKTPAVPKEITRPDAVEPKEGDETPSAPPEPAPSPEDGAPDSSPDEPVLAVPGEPTTGVEESPEETAEDTATEPEGPDNPLRSNGSKRLDIAEQAGAEIGRYLTDTQVAVHFDQDTGNWRRLAPNAVIAVGDRVLTLPSFRPAIALANGTTIQAAGPTSLSFEDVDANGAPVIAVEYGRLVMLTVGKAGKQVHLKLGQRDVTLTFGDAQSRLALEVVGFLAPGTDPEAGPPELAVTLYATSGQIEWSEDGKDNVVKAPEHVSLTARDASTMAPGQLPDWAVREVTNPLDERAATALEKELTFDRPLSLAIKELSQNRRAEVRALAIRCGGYLGDFEAYVSALNDADQRASWSAQIDSLRAAVARGPQTAALVRETFEKQRGGDAKSLYRMLWGYTADQLKADEAGKLVDDLNHDSLDIRVVSFWNLQNITGMSLFYRPEYTVAKRKAAVTKWREKLNAGKILPVPVEPGKASLRSPS